MSRVGKKPIDLPNGTEVSIVENGITIKGQKGELKAIFPESVKLEKEEDKVKVVPLNESKNAKACWGMARTIINNMITGVSKGFSRVLEINGVGSRYDWLEIFRTIVAVIIGILAALGLETLIHIFKRKK